MRVISSPIQDVEVGNIADSSLEKILESYSDRGIIVIVDQTHMISVWSF